MMKIGWAVRDISSDKPVSLTGQFYMRISRGILDPCLATALAIGNNGDIAIFISVDCVSFSDGIIDEIREKVRKRNPAVPAEKILANATHTHAAPSNYAKGTIGVPPHDGIEIAPSWEYREFLTDECASAACEAFEKMENGAIAFGYGYAVVAHSRRVVYLDDLSLRPDAEPPSAFNTDGHVRMYGNTNDDMFSGYESGADHFINILYTFDESEKLTGAIINVPCPAQNSELECLQSSDFWHDVRTLIRKKYGDIFILTQCAAAGDLAPRILHYKEAQDRRYALKFSDVKLDDRAERKTELYNRIDIAERIVDAFDEVYSWAKKDIRRDETVKHKVRYIDLEKRLVSDEQYLSAKEELEKLNNTPYQNTGNAQADLKKNSELEALKDRFKLIIERYEGQLESKTVPMELHTVRIGDIAFASNRFELYMDFQHRIQAQSPFMQTFIIQLAAQPKGMGRGSYLATQKAVDGVGYGAAIFDNLVSPEGGQTIVNETLRDLRELKNN